MDTPERNYLIECMGQHLNERRREFLESALELRTRRIALLLDNLHKEGNIQSILRNCEAFGIQDSWAVRNDRFPVEIFRSVSRGGDKWTDLHIREKEDNEKTYRELKEKGYQIAVTLPGKEALSPAEIPVDKPILFVLGEERWGISDFWKSKADLEVHIPMQGLTESLNVAATAAILLQRATEKLRHSDNTWKLSEEEKSALKLEWYIRAARDGDKLFNHYRNLFSQNNHG